MKIAALLTCFNRKEKTKSCLQSLFEAYNNYGKELFELQVYLTDDNSSDGTSEMVRELFPGVKILKGTGTLYWAGGMRHSWTTASAGSYDAYLLLNDDTTLFQDLFKKIFECADIAKKKFGKQAILVGRTQDPNTNKITYGGSTIKNAFLGTLSTVPFTEKEPLECHMGNANIMWVPKQVFEAIGMLSSGFVHGMADYDYTLTAVKHNIPVLVLPGISGNCENDHGDIYQKFIKLSLKDRAKFLYHPIGLDLTSQLHHMRRNFKFRLPLVFLTGWFKVIFPNIYYQFFYKPRIK